MISNLPALDKLDGLELVLDILSFAGGENTISEDQAMKTEEARVCENWQAISLGGMQREPGFSLAASGSPTYTLALDLLVEHKDAGGTVQYAITNGHFVKKDSAAFAAEDASAFTTGILSHAVSAGGALWITNSTDNLLRKTVGNVIAAPSSQPATPCARIYNHKNRLYAEGSASVPYRVYGSRTGIGNWTAADAWSLANDAWSIDLPEDTNGSVPNFPSGNEILVFTKRNCYALSGFPSTAFRPTSTPGIGCECPYSIALGDEGVYFVSRYPTLGVFLYDGINFKELTQFNKDSFVEKIDLTKRVFGVYKNKRYFLIYNELGSGASYPNRMRIYDARFGRWMNRPVASGLSDNFGYPALLKYSNNELYFGSSRAAKAYSYDDTTTSDAGQETAAQYSTKVFSSRDFAIASGGQFPIDDVKLKLTKFTITYYGLAGNLGFQWTADRGLHSGSRSIDLTGIGDLLNLSFTVNSSYIVSNPPDKTMTYTFSNDAVGRRFQLQISNSGTGTIPKIKKIKVSAVAQDEA